MTAIDTQRGEPVRNKSAMNYGLWAVQAALALLFLFAGGSKLMTPAADLAKQVPLPGMFLKFIGVAEVVGALGLILPGLLRIHTELTPLAAVCLEIIIIGAVVVSVLYEGLVLAILPFVAGIGLLFVIYGRWGRAPQKKFA